MIGVALAAIALAVVNFLVCARMLSRERREHAREAQRWETERSRLIDQMCHLSDKPWSPAPARAPDAPPVVRERDPDDELAVW